MFFESSRIFANTVSVDCRLQIEESRIDDWVLATGLLIGNRPSSISICSLQSPIRQSSVCNRQSSIRSAEGQQVQEAPARHRQQQREGAVQRRERARVLADEVRDDGD